MAYLIAGGILGTILWFALKQLSDGVKDNCPDDKASGLVWLGWFIFVVVSLCVLCSD